MEGGWEDGRMGEHDICIEKKEMEWNKRVRNKDNFWEKKGNIKKQGNVLNEEMYFHSNLKNYLSS